jgi:hypothetical protein
MIKASRRLKNLWHCLPHPHKRVHTITEHPVYSDGGSEKNV